MKKKCIAFPLLFSAPALAIMGGNNENWSEHQAAVDTLGCSGSLIAPDIVLTAAHCDKNAEYVKLHDGTYEKVAGYIDHPLYLETQAIIDRDGVFDPDLPGHEHLKDFNSDIRIVKLENKVKANEIFKLPTERIAHNAVVTLWGFGINDSIFEGDRINKDMFKSASFNVFDYATDESKSAYDDVFEVTPINGSGCFGDSGGSFTDSEGVVHGTFVMTSALNPNDCDPTKDGDALYVYQYTDWIKESIAKLSPDAQDGILSYPTDAKGGQTIRVQNIGTTPAYINASGELLEEGLTECDGDLQPGEECFVKLPEGVTEYQLAADDIVFYNHKGTAGSLTEEEYQNEVNGGGTGQGTGPDSNGKSSSGGSGGSTSLFSLLGLGLLAIRRKMPKSKQA